MNMRVWDDNIKMNINAVVLFLELILYYSTGQSVFFWGKN
jgi:hypothetical protein